MESGEVQSFRQMFFSQNPESPARQAKFWEEPDNVAQTVLSVKYTTEKGYATAYFSQGRFLLWDGHTYQVCSQEQMQKHLWTWLANLRSGRNTERRTRPVPRLTQSYIRNVSLAFLFRTPSLDETADGPVCLPCWRGPEEEYRPLLEASNGLLDWQTGDLLPPDPRWVSPYHLPYPYVENATCPHFLSVLKDNLEDDEERIAVLQEFFGLCLTTDMSFRTSLVLCGPPATGKSLLCGILAELVGSEYTCSLEFPKLTDAHHLAMTRDKKVAFLAEMRKGHAESEDVFKSLVGGDPITLKEFYQKPFRTVPTARVVATCNTFPYIFDKSGATLDRFLVIPFTRTYDRKERDLSLMNFRDPQWPLRSELPGILNWALEGLRRLMKNRQFSFSTVSEKAMNEWLQDADPVRSFLNSECIFSHDSSVEKKTLYEAYRRWCYDQGIGVPNTQTYLTRHLRRYYSAVVKEVRGTAEDRPRIFNGITLRQPRNPHVEEVIQT